MDSVISSEGFRKYNAIFCDHGKNIIKRELLSNDITTQTGKESGRFCVRTAESQKGDQMAPGGVHAGYKNSLYMYQAEKNPDLEGSFEEWLLELTTGLELALEGSMEDSISDSEEGAECSSEDGQTEAYSVRKKEWEEILEQAKVVEAMLRQALENGLGQPKEEKQKPPKKSEEEEPDNEFMLDGVPMNAEGKSKSSIENNGFSGNSQFLQTNTGHEAEYYSQTNGGRQYCEKIHTICLTCETPCNRKKQWKITN